ncbi:hypothetical protein F441_09653 [Phytophthora nicotianae CJ01A1]|uniref:Uncharacterized protein n=5 Tax=Phytophthora nicotianae TaxID=4792 RepID=W2R648_PHYN3|nr:hypothetical protein PPTG_01242 [Phytophthora nicotianae INRA-310]ETI45779.1 hypothetical protein F443_09720 [Phytophthora nicotianae P1569]ETK85763.1 hypothetical protein L915_09511 [Phytophthora nicotianae]ETP15619.1 hypothetical protein F441_09653 [Phytophthora nicotianae CJ01A1]ETP43667.1 hypothetical protein F442_09622 [Phytophthora nicotianae P10297]ETL39192.1 hypothetical protein L916_09414 [Phytophthora nicotianae]
MVFARRLQQLRTLPRELKTNAGSIINLSIARNMSDKNDAEDWSNLSAVLKELRNISRENGLEGDMPDTKLLKELGYGSLVMAIRKKHGGVVEVAAKMGTRKDEQVVDVHKKVSARAKRRQKRQERLNKHDFY